MKSIIIFICFITCITTLADTAWTHGVRGRITSEAGILVEAEYDDGDPMSYSAVEVSNLKEKLPFQTGRTDRNGKFLFLPDKSGDWKVVINDGMGHRLVVKTSIDESINLNKSSGQSDSITDGGSLSRYEKVLMGITMIFGIFGFLFWWNGRKFRSKCDV